MVNVRGGECLGGERLTIHLYVDLLLFVMKPVELISKQFTVVLFSVMSVTKGAYFLLFHCVVGRY